MNHYFPTISEKLKSEHPQDSPEYDAVNLDNYIKNKIPNDIQFKLSDLINAMKSLDVTKARGLDGLTLKSLKTSAEIIAPAVLKIINISLLNGQFTEPFKLAKIKPIQKEIQNLTNRIIALFQCFRFYKKKL